MVLCVKTRVFRKALKAAEIVMNTEGPSGMYHKAQALKTLFKDSLQYDFADNFDPKNSNFSTPDIAESKKELLKLIVENPQFDKNETIEIWGTLFPSDEAWLYKLRKGRNQNSNNS